MMIDRGLTPKWQAQVRTDVARDEELLSLMRRSGCHRLELGFESVDQVTLDGYDKSQTVEDITKAIAALHRHHIKVHGMFVVGADNDTARSAHLHGRLRREARDRQPDAEHPHARSRHEAVRADECRRPRLRTPLAVLRRPARHLHAAEDDAPGAADLHRRGIPSLLLSPARAQVPGAPALRQRTGAPLGEAVHPPLSEGPEEPRLRPGTGSAFGGSVGGRPADDRAAVSARERAAGG